MFWSLRPLTTEISSDLLYGRYEYVLEQYILSYKILCFQGKSPTIYHHTNQSEVDLSQKYM